SPNSATFAFLSMARRAIHFVFFFLAAAFPSAENISTGNKTMEIANTINRRLIPSALLFVFPQSS
ncbi:MAG: hypothetical protein O7C72_00800, partial [Deltaproteobacteria bacterium]|nr:hypothetical protein [Deltaproteobacteria bacterium]